MILTEKDKDTLNKVISEYEVIHAELSGNEDESAFDESYTDQLRLESIIETLTLLVETQSAKLSVGA